ncbi:hypothetical protein VNI00_013420 [Paramarasmius palmivorus]|uniref:F-box protein n=1 Tax=Paramarasmius palmivorus TaxID=297713 RepID=A0AAW0C1I3_9AGAR
MPGLQRLKLHDVLPPAHSEAPPPTTPPVHLAHLSYASLSSSIPQIAKLLQYITLPDAAHIDLYNCRFAAISTRAMFTELASHLNPLIAKLVGNAEIESLRVTDKHPFIKGITPSDCIIFEMHTTGFSPDKVASEFWSLRPRKNVTSLNLVKVPRLCLDIRLLQDDFWHESEQVVPAICKRLDLHFLHTLSLELKGSELHGAALHKCFGTIPKLTDLTITQSVIIPFFEAVMDPGFDPDEVVPFDSNLWSTTAQEMETPTTFDHLNFLRVHDSDFTATRFKHRWDTLIHLLGVDWYRKSQARRGGQATLKLVFSNSVLFGQQISQLRERSEELEFEGCRFIEDDARWKEYSAPSPWPE